MFGSGVVDGRVKLNAGDFAAGISMLVGCCREEKRGRIRREKESFAVFGDKH